MALLRQEQMFPYTLVWKNCEVLVFKVFERQMVETLKYMIEVANPLS